MNSLRSRKPRRPRLPSGSRRGVLWPPPAAVQRQAALSAVVFETILPRRQQLRVEPRRHVADADPLDAAGSVVGGGANDRLGKGGVQFPAGHRLGHDQEQPGGDALRLVLREQLVALALAVNEHPGEYAERRERGERRTRADQVAACRRSHGRCPRSVVRGPLRGAAMQVGKWWARGCGWITAQMLSGCPVTLQGTLDLSTLSTNIVPS